MSTKLANNLQVGDVVLFRDQENEPQSALIMDSSRSEFKSKIEFVALFPSGQWISFDVTPDQEVAVA